MNNKDQNFLRKLEICCPEVNIYLNEMEKEERVSQTKHQEEYSSFIIKYIQDCKKVFAKLTINPFIENEFQKLDVSSIFPDSITAESKIVTHIGSGQYEKFLKDRFIMIKEDVTSKITKNNLKLPHSANLLRRCHQRLHYQITCLSN